MVILLGNQKGGAGKSTLTILLSNYLAKEYNLKVTVVDMDDQRSVEDEYLDAQKLENKELYSVIGADLSHFTNMYENIFSKNTEEVIIIDMPGKLDDDNLAVLFEKGDLIVCPFMYEKKVFKSTVLFSMVVRHINSEIKIHYVPNRVRGTVVYNAKASVHEKLKEFGSITPAIAEKEMFQKNLNTYSLDPKMYADIVPAFEDIYRNSILPYLENLKKGG